MSSLCPKRKDCLLLLVITSILYVIQRSDARKICPNFCKCDLYNGRNRADCSAKRLINPNLDISAAVEILDLSYNDITTLDDSCFQHYNFLINITIAHNAIQTIYLDAFTKLPRVNDINLSYNRLQYLDERLFETNHKLHTLNLDGNKFTTLKNKPFLRSTSLLTLSLRNSQIDHINARVFSALPQLQQLDLAQNPMISIELDAFNAPQQLKHLNLNENPWQCDTTLLQAVEMIEKRGIRVDLEDCKRNRQLTGNGDEPTFERMEIANSAELITNEHNYIDEEYDSEHESLTDTWRNLEYEDEDYAAENESRLISKLLPSTELCDGSPMELCRKYRKCLEKVSNVLFEETDSEKRNEKVCYNQSDLNFIFCMGVTVGIALVILIITCALCFKGFFEGHRKQVVQHEVDEALIGAMRQPSTSTAQNTAAYARPIPVRVVRTSQAQAVPVPPLRRPKRGRSSRSSAAPSQSRVVARSEMYGHSSRDNFISRLFGRPARHQYYRTINQNTATLIRRLSRSNLFNNRLSQHFERERERDRSDDITPPNTPAINNSPLVEQAAPIHYVDANVANILCTATAPLMVTTTRPETPPPNYGDVVVLDSCYRK